MIKRSEAESLWRTSRKLVSWSLHFRTAYRAQGEDNTRTATCVLVSGGGRRKQQGRSGREMTGLGISGGSWLLTWQRVGRVWWLARLNHIPTAGVQGRGGDYGPYNTKTAYKVNLGAGSGAGETWLTMEVNSGTDSEAERALTRESTVI